MKSFDVTVRVRADDCEMAKCKVLPQGNRNFRIVKTVPTPCKRCGEEPNSNLHITLRECENAGRMTNKDFYCGAPNDHHTYQASE